MSVQIAKKIVGYQVVDTKAKSSPAKPADPAPKPEAAAPAAAAAPASAEIVQMHEKLERPEILRGETYKIKSPMSEHAIYLTINDAVLNAGTPNEVRRPFEVFFNSKDMEQFQWIVALTRVMSAVFRKGGDVTFLVDELKVVFDPRGGYYKPGGVFVPSIIAEVGNVIERHLQTIGLLKPPELSAAQKELIASKRAAYEKKLAAEAQTAKPGVAEAPEAEAPVTETEAVFPPGARTCQKCNKQALIRMDNCDTCLNCGASKCN